MFNYHHVYQEFLGWKIEQIQRCSVACVVIVQNLLLIDEKRCRVIYFGTLY